MSSPAISLPITAVLPDIKAHLARSLNLVLQAPPGAGKTTLVPLSLLDQPWLTGQSILILEPRRLAAKAAAARMASLLGEAVGQQVGYQIRLERKISSRTRIQVLTEGILTRRLQQDPTLEGVGLVIFDEFHERSLHADLALALCRDSQQQLRVDLRLLIMSATLNQGAIAQLLGAPIITSQGRCHPITLHYLPQDPAGPMTMTPLLMQSLVQALTDHRGDILVFLPGAREIRDLQRCLENHPHSTGLAIFPLFGDLSQAEQQRALQPLPQQRKIVLATPIAETSLTIDGISVVIDSGWMRTPRFEPRTGLTRLDTLRIGMDSAEQRAGRAGRLGPGVCYRLWSPHTQQQLQPHRVPEILEADLASLTLELAQWGETDPTRLSWLDPPPPAALEQARGLLMDLQALDRRGYITPLGRRLVDLPLHPRLAHLLIKAHELGWEAMAGPLAALLSERDILRGTSIGCDIRARLEALEAFQHRGPAAAKAYGADPSACARIVQIIQSWSREMPRNPNPRVAAAGANGPGSSEDIGLLLAFAYPDRIAQRRSHDTHRYLLANGRGVRLREDDPLVSSPWLVAAHLDAGHQEGIIHLAAPLSPADLEDYLGQHIVERESIGWNHRQQAVEAHRKRRLGHLTLSQQPLENPDPQAICQAMLKGIHSLGLDSLPWQPSIRQWQARVLLLRDHYPHQEWPDVSDDRLAATLDQWLAPHLQGISRREHLQRLDLAHILQQQLPWHCHGKLEQYAPSHWQAPSGSRIPVQYLVSKNPVLAVKLQELFGLADTPHLAEGRIPVTLHLLSPARRPIQVTQDLRGFWERTYPEVKKQLKGRYPKHYWPEDPWTATPTRHTRPASVNPRPSSKSGKST